MNTRNSVLRVAGFATAGMFLGLTATASALSPPPPQPDDELLPLLYESLGGEHWVNNHGWLDPEIHWCDWHGVVCGEEFWPGFFELYAIELADNNLTGEMTPELAELLAGDIGPDGRLDLSDNSITGPLHKLPGRTQSVDLSNNRFSGALPAVEPDDRTENLEILSLDGNTFEGPVPESWDNLSLHRLDLANNRLSGASDPAFGALDPAEASLIDLSDNAFSGELPSWVTDLPLEQDFGVVGTVNICWTAIGVNDTAVRDWLAERHVGGPDFESCLARERRMLDASVSGSWFDPTRSGEGYSVMLLDSGVPLAYWFTHLSLSRQMWLIGIGRHDEASLRFDELLQTEGRFGEGFGSIEMPIGRKGELRMDGIADGPIHLSSTIGYTTSDLAQPSDGPIIFLPNPIDFRMDLARLSELAGTTCDNQTDFQQFSGAWYDPERSGEGLIVEVLPDDRANVYWFTYEPGTQGRQAWMIGQGQITLGDVCLAPGCEAPTVIEITEMWRPVDTGQSFPADLEGVENILWGEVRIAFGSNDSGRVFYESQENEFGEGEFPIERLARPMLAECD